LLLPAAALTFLRKPLGCLADALPGPRDALLSALTYTLQSLAGAFSDLTYGLLSSFADLAGGLTGALANVLHRAFGAFANLIDGLAGLADEITRAFANVFNGVTDPFKQLGVAVERGQHALEDQSDIVEPGLQERLRLDTLDLQLHFAEADIGADSDFDQIAHFRHDCHLRSQVVDLDVDLVDLDDWDVEEDIRAIGKLVRIDDRVVGELGL
jgi:hypothetical protein